MSAPGIAESILRLALLLAGLLVPGTMLLRALRLRWSLAASFGLSTAVLYALMLGFSLNGAEVSLPTFGVSLALVTLLARLIPGRGLPAREQSPFACYTRLGGWTPLYGLFWCIVGWRLVTQPLTGPDVYFRWSWLAEQIVQIGALDFYPPRSSADFARYFWAESVPPGIAGLYTWSYLCGGSFNALWTSPAVALQLLALHELIWRIGNRWGGEIVARRALMLAAATPLLTWSVLIGQESGLIAVAVAGLAWCLPRLRDPDGERWAVLAGVFAVLAASAREYGIAVALAAAVVGSLSGASRRPVLVLILVAVPLACAWPLRVWLLTGNPFHSLDVSGWFPVNEGFVVWSKIFHAPHAGQLSSGSDWAGLFRYLALWALPGLIGLVALLALLVRRLGDAHIAGVLIGVVIMLWWGSLPFTAGGLFYSLRVLAPALGLAVVLGAYGITRWHSPTAHRVLMVAIALTLVESLPKTLVLPLNPYAASWRDWPDAGRRFSDSVRAAEDRLLETFRTLPAAPRVMTDNASLPRVFARAGVEAVPPWSPDIAWLFDDRLSSNEVARFGKSSDVRYLVLGKSASGVEYVMSRARWQDAGLSVKAVAETPSEVILEVVGPEKSTGLP